jgi:hypothetical protein
MVFGVVFLIVGVAGLLVESGAGMHMGRPLDEYPRLFGLFPINLAHNFVHLLFGVLGMAASRSFAGSVTYAKVGGVVYLVLAALGFVAPTTFGFIPIGGNDIWLHAVLGVALAAIGFTARESAPAVA